MHAAYGLPSLFVGTMRDSAGIDDNNIGGIKRFALNHAAAEKTFTDGGAVGLITAATESQDEKTSHLYSYVNIFHFTTVFMPQSGAKKPLEYLLYFKGFRAV
jgi:hypothetical protein